jgi:8-oxo-dGTP pyrophosphatase MutT (NUDIX family)
MRLGKSQREKEERRVASTAVFNAEGKMLFGRRQDTGKWSLPGGRFEPGESPFRAAVRECVEETGLKPKSLKILGSETVTGHDGETVEVFAFEATAEGKPSGANDPDEEFGDDFEWVDVSNGLPVYIADNLHSPRNVVLKLMGLQDWGLAKADPSPTRTGAIHLHEGQIHGLEATIADYHADKRGTVRAFGEPKRVHTLVHMANGRKFPVTVHLHHFPALDDPRGVKGALQLHTAVDYDTGKARTMNGEIHISASFHPGMPAEELHQRIRSVLAHEMTHAADPSLHARHVAVAESQWAKRGELVEAPPVDRERTPREMVGYYNDKFEVTARMQQIVRELLDEKSHAAIKEAHDHYRADPAYPPPYRPEEVLAWSPTWERVGHHLTPQNRRRVLSNVATLLSGIHNGHLAPIKKNEMPDLKELAKMDDDHPLLDDEVGRLLRHPDPHERCMALKLSGVTAAHLKLALENIHDEKGRVHHRLLEAILRHPQFNREIALHTLHAPIRKFEDDLKLWLKPLNKAFVTRDQLLRYGWRSPRSLASAAAAFLSGLEADPRAARSAAWAHDQDHVAAALAAHGLPVNDEMRQSVAAVQKLQDRHGQPTPTKAPDISHPKDIVPGTAEAQDVAEAVRASFKGGDASPISLGGKHSAGTILARGVHATYLLKPGSGDQSPAAGAREEGASQSQREAAFYHVAHAWGLGDDLPRAELLLIDGAQVAALAWLSPDDWEQLEKAREDENGAPVRILEPYRVSGRLHQWAVLDFVLGQTDRHFGNVMVKADGTGAKLIDHGAAFAGADFDPAHDRASFVPCYLRLAVPVDVNFNAQPLEEKLRGMAQTSEDGRRGLATWVAAIDAQQLRDILAQFGIDPQPTLDRLARVKALVGPLDEDVNRLWVTV